MNSFDLLDDGFHLLRSLPASAWLFHLTGGLPFLLALFLCATETGILYTPEKGLTNSLLCTVAFLSLQFWRARFAGKLEELLRPETASPWTATRAVKCFCVQAGFQSARIILIPLAALVTIPYASATAFFQYVTVLSTHPPLSLRALARNASRLSVPNQKQLWLVMSLLSAIGIVVFLNFIVLAISLPTLLKSLTGMENQFTRGTGQILTLRVLEFALGATWLAVSPLAQAVFVKQMYLAEARTTGADLLALLRRPLTGIRFAAPLALLCCASHVLADVPPPDLEKNIRQVLTERQYSWHDRVERATIAQPDFLDRAAERLRSTVRAIGDGMRWLGEELRRMFDTNSSEPKNDPVSPAPRSVRWAVLALTVAIAAGFVSFFLRRKLAKIPVNEPDTSIAAPNLEDDTLQAVALPEESWIALAHELIERSEYRLALRALYLAMLAHLGGRELLALGKAKTNRDYTHELRRRMADDQLNMLFRENVRAFEASWYGNYPASETNLLAFQQNLNALRAYGN